AISLVPFSVGGHNLSFSVHMLLVITWRFPVQETHQRAVGNERDDTFGLIVKSLETADPDKHHNEPNACHDNARSVRSRGHLKKPGDLFHSFTPLAQKHFPCIPG